ncbi:MAG: imelysin family protein [Candidatus Kapabacteria bacterium]|nr:imelysin family protein [Candidatus Kapabacteria bacterium]
MRCLLVAACLVFMCACTNDTNNTKVDSFDRTAMLRGVADKAVIPSFTDLQVKSDSVALLVTQFAEVNIPTTQQIQVLRDAIANLTTVFQSVIVFDFGPAEGSFGSLVENVSTFPVNTSSLEEFIAAADTSFLNFQRDTRGLSALDYLYFRGTTTDVIAAFSGKAGANRRVYAKAVANAIARETRVVLNAWTGSYRQQFIDRSGTDAGSSVSLLFNNLNISYELLKNYKIALPLGKRAGQSSTEPTRVESYYQSTSLELARLHFNATVNLWYGKTPQGDTFPSFRSYLKTVVNGDRLITDAEAQIVRVEEEFTALGTSVPLSTLVTTNPTAVEPLYIEMQKLTRFLKSEMSSLLGISITYSSGDGD